MSGMPWYLSLALAVQAWSAGADGIAPRAGPDAGALPGFLQAPRLGNPGWDKLANPGEMEKLSGLDTARMAAGPPFPAAAPDSARLLARPANRGPGRVGNPGDSLGVTLARGLSNANEGWEASAHAAWLGATNHGGYPAAGPQDQGFNPSVAMPAFTWGGGTVGSFYSDRAAPQGNAAQPAAPRP